MSNRYDTRMETNIGTIYLLHFSKPYMHAQHYLGWSQDVEGRLQTHVEGNGNPLVAAASAAGSEITLVRTWTGDRHFERRLKNKKNARSLCPICKPDKNKKHAEGQRRRRANRKSNPTGGKDLPSRHIDADNLHSRVNKGRDQ